MDHRTVPLIVTARRDTRALRSVATSYEKRRDMNRWEDQPAIYVLSYWTAIYRPD